MNARQKSILCMVSEEGEVSIKELASRLCVSEMTVHRDLDALQEQRYLYKKRGAAVFVEQDNRCNTDFYADEKRRIGIKAAEFIENGSSVIFDNSTTVLECAGFIDPTKRCTFYTTGIETAGVLSKYSGSVLYCSGGYYFPDSQGFVGAVAEAFISSIRADVCFIGASGISEERGISTPYPLHTPLQRAIIASSKKRILLCDHSKFGKSAIETVCEIGDIDMIITDSGIGDKILEEYTKHTKIILA